MIVMILLVSSFLAEAKDSDLDGIEDTEDKYPFDFDNDGMPDIWEKKMNLKPEKADANEDPDNDGVKNINEYRQGTDPLVSDKTQERVQQEMFSPVEAVLARSLIWIGVGFIILVIIMIIIYKSHLSRIFKFLHHGSKHFEKQQKMTTYKPRMPQQQPPRQINQIPPQTQATQNQQNTQQQAPRPPTPPPQQQNNANIHQTPPTINQKVTQPPPGVTQKVAIPLEKMTQQPPRQETEQEKPDVFAQLSDHVDNYKKLEKIAG